MVLNWCDQSTRNAKIYFGCVRLVNLNKLVRFRENFFFFESVYLIVSTLRNNNQAGLSVLSAYVDYGGGGGGGAS